MAHEITSTDTMFSVREVPWHGLGTVVSETPNSTEAIKLAGLDWNVEQQRVSYDANTKTGQINITLNDRFINYRSDTGEFLGIVSNEYKPVQNVKAFEFTDGLLEIDEGITYETAGSIKGGKHVWLLAKMPEKIILGDSYNPFMLFSCGHDGKTPVTVTMTPVRVVCSNTLTLALSTSNSHRTWRFTHNGNIMDKLHEAKMIVLRSTKYMEDFEKEAEEMGTAKVSNQDIQNLLGYLFPIEITDGKRKQNSVRESIESFNHCYNMDDLSNIRGTKWGIISAISDMETHHKKSWFREKEKQIAHRENIFWNTIQNTGLIAQAYTFLKSI